MSGQQRVLCFAIAMLLALGSAGASNQIPARIFNTSDGTCPSSDQQAAITSQIVTEVKQLINRGSTVDNPASSCDDVVSGNPSGYYWILPDGEQSVMRMYCDFNRQCGCDGPSTWTRVAFLNMSDPNYNCPSGWLTISSPVRSCGQGTQSRAGCSYVSFPTHGLTYNRVCGRIVGYQHGVPTAFEGFTPSTTIDSTTYLEGVSVIHGSPGNLQHVWSFAAATAEVEVVAASWICDCSNGDDWPFSTGYIGDDYFCDSGSRNTFSTTTFFADDPLWDGKGCGPASTCCTFNNPPWFCKTLPQPTTDALQVRVCHSLRHRDTPVNLIELFVQ